MLNITDVRVVVNSSQAASKLDLNTSDKHLKLALHYPSSDDISVTLPDAPKVNRLDYSLTSVGKTQASHFNALRLSTTGQLTIAELPTGKYSLSIIGYQPHTFEILDAKKHSDWATLNGEAIELSSDTIPHIAGASVVDGKLIIDVDQQGLLARLHIIGSQFSESSMPYSPAMPTSAATQRQKFGFDPSIYKNGGTLSSEHQYILNRRSAGYKLGNMLERPAWHLNPWHSTSSESFSNDEFGAAPGLPSAAAGFGSSDRSRRSSGIRRLSESSSPVSFLNNPAVILANLTPNKDGKFVLDLDKLQGLKRVDIILTQGEHSDSLQLSLPGSDLETRDLRLAKSLDIKTKYIPSETRAQLKAGAQAKITNVLNAKWKAYTKLSDVFSYFHTHSLDDKHRNALNELSPILKWPKLTQKERLLLLSESACHELHLFIKLRDTAWFSKHIVPQLEMKLRKDFMDHYLLDHDLSSYKDLGRFHSLNTMEQALLAQRLKSKPMRALLKSRYTKNKPSNEANTATFASLLNQGFENKLDEYKPQYAQNSSAINRKLKGIIIPLVDFKNTSLDEALEFLNSRAAELDHFELDPALKGINFVSLRPSSALGEFGGSTFRGIESLQLRNVSIETALANICDSVGARYVVTNSGVQLLWSTDTEDTEFFTQSFKVPKDFMALMNDSGSDDSFAETADESSISTSPSVKDLLVASGVVMPEGATASFKNGVLTVRNTANNNDILKELTQSVVNSRAATPSQVHDMRSSSSNNLPKSNSILPTTFSDDPFADDDSSSFGFGVVEADSLPHETKYYSESYYFERKRSDGKQDVAINQFWVDLAHWDGKSDFLSPHFADCSVSQHQALVALAVMGLPFESEDADVQVANNTMTVTAKQPMLLYYQDLRKSPADAKDSALLSSLRYFWSGNQFSVDEDGKKSENAITGDFKAQILYDAQLVITNPSGIEREIDILRQIPEGSIRLGDSETLSSTKTTIQPRGTWTHTVQFYFPQTGTFTHYPPQVHQDGKSVSLLQPQKLIVHAELPIQLTDSWTKVALTGTDEQVLTALRTHELHTIAPKLLSGRMENSKFYKAASKILRERMIENLDLAAFALQHHDQQGVKELLGNPSTSGNLFGYHVDSDLLNLSPYDSWQFEDSEWRPLINQRAFPLVDQNRITNTKVWDDYLNTLNHLIWKKELGSNERLTLAYHLYLHDRNDDANKLIESCKREETDAKMQFDYLTCYRHFLNGDAKAASKLASTWTAKAQAPWKQRFEVVVKQADQIARAEY